MTAAICHGNPDGIANQIEGGLIQSAELGAEGGSSKFDDTRVLSDGLGELPDPHLQRGAAGRGRPDRPAGRALSRHRRNLAMPDRRCDRQCRVRCGRRTRHPAAADTRSRQGRHGRLTPSPAPASGGGRCSGTGAQPDLSRAGRGVRAYAFQNPFHCHCSNKLDVGSAAIALAPCFWMIGAAVRATE